MEAVMPSTLSDPVAVRMPTDVLQGIDEVAELLDRKRSWVVVRALRNYLQGEGKYLVELAAARESARKADAISGDDLIAELLADAGARLAK
jgi:predicted transcriptional regulator